MDALDGDAGSHPVAAGRRHPAHAHASGAVGISLGDERWQTERE
jgi:hypothetical protein